MKWPWEMSCRSCGAKWMLGIGVAVIGYTLIGFLLLPVIIKWQLRVRLAAKTQCAVAVQQVQLNPFTLTLTVRGLSLTASNGVVLGAVAEASARLRPVSIVQRGWIFCEINVNRPTGHVLIPQAGPVAYSNLVSATTRIAVERLNIAAGELVVDDANGKHPLKLSQIRLQLAGYSNQADTPVTTVLSFVCNGTGTVALRGTVNLAAQTADMQVQVTDWNLRALQPYVSEIWQLEITSGTLTATGRLQVAVAGKTAPVVQFAGELGVANFASVDMASHEEFLNLEALTLAGLNLRYLPHGLDIATANITGLQGNLFVRADKSSNLKGLLKDAKKLHELVVQLQLNKLFPFQVGPVTFANSSLRFADHSLAPPVAAEILQVAGRITGLSSATNATIRVDLHGKVDGTAPLAVTGTINPLADDLKLDLKLALQNGEMPAGSPYAAKYVGYPIHQGQLTIAAHYTVNHRVLQAENKFTTQHLRLGAKNDSPDISQLHIKLAVALLQDRDGVLTFDVPVTGKLDDPQFQFGPVITDVFRRIILKAVSNPFALLGTFMGDSAQLSFVNFEPGRADFVVGEMKKLDVLAQALAAHPALELEIAGSVDVTNDRIALATNKLREFKARWNLTAVPETTVTQPTGPTQNFGPSNLPGAPVPLLSLPVAQAYASLRFTESDATIIAAIAITHGDYRALRQARAERVRDYLLGTGQVAADRLFIIAPAPVDSSSPGMCRVNLALQ